MGWIWTSSGDGFTTKTKKAAALDQRIKQLETRILGQPKKNKSGPGAAPPPGAATAKPTGPGQRQSAITVQIGPRKGLTVGQVWHEGDVGCQSCGSICCRPHAEACFTCGSRLKKHAKPTTPPAQTAGSSAADTGPGPVASAVAQGFTQAAGSLTADTAAGSRQSMSLPAGLLKELDPLLPSLRQVLDSLKQEMAPAASALPSPEAEMDKWLGESRPLTKAAERGRLQARIQSTQQSLLVLASDHPCLPILQTQLQSDQTSLAKLEREGFSTAGERTGVIEAKAKYERHLQTRKDAAASAAARAADRATSRRRHLATLRELITKVHNALGELEQEQSRAHAARSQLHEQQANAVLALFNTKIELLDQNGASSAGATTSHGRLPHAGPQAGEKPPAGSP